jgi:hypothetical protein
MKQTFSNKYLDWVLIAVAVFFSVYNIKILFNVFDFFNSYLLRIAFSISSVLAISSLVIKNMNGEKYSRFFIIIVLIFPSLFLVNTYITDLAFYGVNKTDLLKDSFLYINLIFGIMLFMFSIKYSKQTKPTRISNYGILISYVGIFAIILIVTHAIQANFIAELNNVPIWKIIIKSIIGLLIILVGYQLKNEKIKLTKGLFFSILLIFIYGLL